MKNPFIWVAFYSLVMSISQLLLKFGTNQTGKLNVTSLWDIFPLLAKVFLNPYILIGSIMLSSAFVFWLVILSFFNLGVVFPLTALMYIFVAWMSYFMLGESMGLINYLGMLFIAVGVFFLLYK
jgi:drug/metabolite transporter (DMT)-like permease